MRHRTKPCTAETLISDTFGLSGPERLRTLKHQKKVEPRAWEGRVVGFGQGSLAYGVYHAGSQTVRENRNVIFIETPSVVPAPDFETAFDEGTFAYGKSDDLVRDVRNFLPRKDLGSSSGSGTSATRRCFAFSKN